MKTYPKLFGLILFMIMNISQAQELELYQPTNKSAFFQPYDSVPEKSATIEFVGQGNLQESFTSQSKIPVNTGIGVQFREYLDQQAWNQHNGYLFLYGIEVEVIINVASTRDSLVAEYENDSTISNNTIFGSSVLTPLNSGRSGAINLRGYFREKLCWGILSGFETHFLGSSLDYYLKDSKLQATIIDYNFNLFHEFIPMGKRDQYSITFGIGLNARNIGGDIKSKEDQREMIFHTKERFFIGPHVKVGLRLKNLKAELYNNWLYPNDNAIGLTGNQIITSISFTGGFPLKLE
ncbi:hypothetical protein LVD15_21800 [Fulvivirga maritima]|uniref:hypothetical protein n=1 Tax=Fulvivirga maritima TaxID=2904247 RepID=UPI001F3EA4F6|nr:hypothetical protein [Fulvivirga maritima]UII25907.1 hypothetical protein LVD15_21800 [Fulvivirga maritima]